MHIPSARTRRDMELAAELRVAGATWDDIAEKLKRHPNLVLRWTSRYREEWEQMLRAAEGRAKLMAFLPALAIRCPAFPERVMTAVSSTD